MEPAKVKVRRYHIPAQPLERFDQVRRYMRRHGGTAVFVHTRDTAYANGSTEYTLKEMIGGKRFRQDMLAQFNAARKVGGNQ